MVKAAGNISVNGKIYRRGQEVAGLSPVDIAWMEAEGFLTASTERKRGGTAGNAQKEGQKAGKAAEPGKEDIPDGVQ